jgi:hypothetical protein
MLLATATCESQGVPQPKISTVTLSSTVLTRLPVYPLWKNKITLMD